MRKKWRRYEVLLPRRFNDGKPVPSAWLAEAVNEIMEGSMEKTTFEKRTIDVTGLPDEAVRAIESLVYTLRKQAMPSVRFASYEDWSKALHDWVASHAPVSNVVDWSRESIYAGRGE